jgi:lipase
VKTYDTFDVPVEGGSLRVGRWRGDADAPVVVAAHGITSNHLSWALVGERSRATVVAPDLRGRGRSSEVSGEAGVEQHSADLVAVVDRLGAERVVLVGHSMGAFVAAAFHERAPGRTEGVVLVDGGLPLTPLPPGTSTEEGLAATIGPAAQRLTMTFGSTEEFYDHWRAHPGVGPHWSQAFAEYFAYELVPDSGSFRSSVSLDAVRRDTIDLMDTEAPARRARMLPPGTVFLRAPYGILGQPVGLYPELLAAAHAIAFTDIDVRDVPDVNHYTVVLSDPGASAVAAVLDDVGH